MGKGSAWGDGGGSLGGGGAITTGLAVRADAPGWGERPRQTASATAMIASGKTPMSPLRARRFRIASAAPCVNVVIGA